MASFTRAPAGRYGDVEARILAATEELLAGGATFTEIGVQRITAAACVSRSTFYVYFHDKTDLLVRLTQLFGEESYRHFEDWLPDEEDALEQLALRFSQVTAYYRQNSHLLTAVLEVAAYDREFATFWQQRFDPFLTNITNLLRREQEAARTSDSFDPVVASRVMVSSATQTIAQQIVRGDEDDDVAVARELALLQWYGAYRRPGPVAGG